MRKDIEPISILIRGTEKNRNEIMKIYEQDGYYSNLEILKDVAKIYGIKLKGNRILDLIKFKNIIEIKILQ